LILNPAFKEHITQHNLTVFTNSRAIILEILDKTTNKTPGAH
jgi:hypothetical protein